MGAKSGIRITKQEGAAATMPVAAESPVVLENFKILADRSPGMIDVHEYATGRYIYVNPAVRHLLGYKQEDLLKGGLEFITSRIHPDDAARALRKYMSACQSVAAFRPEIDDSKPFVSLEYRVSHKNGSWVWLHTDASVYSRDEDGSLEYIINTCVDITEQKASELKLRELTRQLNESHALMRIEHNQLLMLNNTKDDFISIASHQLRTPATGIKQYVHMLLDGYAGKLSARQNHMLEIIRDCNERELRLIDDLLTVVRIDAGKVRLKKAKFDLIRMFMEIKDELQSTLRALGQRLEIEDSSKSTLVNGDESFIRMVAENLIDNASKYSQQGREVKVAIASDDKYGTFSVKDRGIGIAKRDQSKLFHKFSRIESAHTYNVSGTGLGLYWAKKIVDLHGGTITVKSRRGAGATFSVSLPLA